VGQLGEGIGEIERKLCARSAAPAGGVEGCDAQGDLGGLLEGMVTENRQPVRATPRSSRTVAA